MWNPRIPSWRAARADKAEIKYIYENKPYYNILSGGRSGFSGYYHSSEIRAKLSVLASSRKVSESVKARLSQSITGSSNPFYGIHHTQETKQQISITKTHGFIYIYDMFYENLFLVSSGLQKNVSDF